MSSPVPSSDDLADLCDEIGELVEAGERTYLAGSYTESQQRFVEANGAINEMIRKLAELAGSQDSASSDAK